MWSWILRIIAAALAAVGAGVLALAFHAFRRVADRLLDSGLPIALAVLAAMLLVAAVAIVASPVARPSVRR